MAEHWARTLSHPRSSHMPPLPGDEGAKESVTTTFPGSCRSAAGFMVAVRKGVEIRKEVVRIREVGGGG